VFLQFVIGISAGVSGAMLLVPLAAQIVSSIRTGRRIQRSGRYVSSPRTGFAILTAAALLLATMNAATPLWLIEIYLTIHCVGIGFCQAPLWVAVQNSAELRDLGAVTGSTAFFRALGGAFGVAILWSSLLLVLDHTMAAGGQGLLGSELMRGGRAGLAALAPETRAILIQALSHAFAVAFALGAAIAGAAFITTYFLKEIPLRTTTHQPKAEGQGAD
jgi:hypothetical protein